MKRATPYLLALLGVLVAGCGQTEIKGAKDRCPDQQGVTLPELRKCWKDQHTILIGKRAAVDRTARGRLRGEALPLSGRDLQHVIALDYSGSMYGGYDDSTARTEGTCGWQRKGGSKVPNGPFYWEIPGFQRLLAEGPLATIGPKDPVYPMVFGREVVLLGRGSTATAQISAKGARFPRPLPAPYHGTVEPLKRLSSSRDGTLPAKPWSSGLGSSRMYQESRLRQVLQGGAAVFESFKARDGVLWIVTDNIIETVPRGAAGQSTATRDVENNKDFYTKLKNDPRWQVVYAWPIHKADWLCGSTLLVYGLYYSSRTKITEQIYADLCKGEPARLNRPEQTKAFSRFASSDSPSPGRPFKLKPNDMDVVRISFDGVIQCPAAEAGQARICKVNLQIQNLLNHRQVDSAQIKLSSSRLEPLGKTEKGLEPVRTAVPMCNGAARGTLQITKPLPPRGKAKISVHLKILPVLTERHNLADVWESAQFEKFVMLGRMDVHITKLRTSMVIQPDDLNNVYGVAALPAMFRNPNTDTMRTNICLVMTVANPSHVASILLLILIGVLLLWVAVIGWLIRPS